MLVNCETRFCNYKVRDDATEDCSFLDIADNAKIYHLLRWWESCEDNPCRTWLLGSPLAYLAVVCIIQGCSFYVL